MDGERFLGRLDAIARTLTANGNPGIVNGNGDGGPPPGPSIEHERNSVMEPTDKHLVTECQCGARKKQNGNNHKWCY